MNTFGSGSKWYHSIWQWKSLYGSGTYTGHLLHPRISNAHEIFPAVSIGLKDAAYLVWTYLGLKLNGTIQSDDSKITIYCNTAASSGTSKDHYTLKYSMHLTHFQSFHMVKSLYSPKMKLFGSKSKSQSLIWQFADLIACAQCCHWPRQTQVRPRVWSNPLPGRGQKVWPLAQSGPSHGNFGKSKRNFPWFVKRLWAMRH